MSAEAAKIGYESSLLWTNKLNRYVAVVDLVLCSSMCAQHCLPGMCIPTLSASCLLHATPSHDWAPCITFHTGEDVHLHIPEPFILEAIEKVGLSNAACACRLTMRRQNGSHPASAGPRSAANGNGTVGGSSNYVI